MKTLRLLLALALTGSGAACSTAPTGTTRPLASRTAPPAFTPRTAATAVPGAALVDTASPENAAAEPTGKSSWLAPVKPWQRGHLAEYVMLPNRDPLTSSIAEHVYFTREAFAGGRGVGGGGCGCN